MDQHHADLFHKYKQTSIHFFICRYFHLLNPELRAKYDKVFFIRAFNFVNEMGNIAINLEALQYVLFLHLLTPTPQFPLSFLQRIFCDSKKMATFIAITRIM